MKQLKLFKKEKTEFGGSLLQDKRKSLRPLSTKTPIFLTIKGDATESGSLLKYRKQLDEELFKWAHKFNIQIYSHCINHDHIHTCIEITTIEGYKNFIRTFCGRSAKITKIKWTQRPHTELVSKGRHFDNIMNYIIKNHEEAIGQRPYIRKSREQKNMRIKQKAC